jgi:hypothetical protein
VPPAVIDRVKAVTLQALTSAVAGTAHPSAREIVAMIADEERGVVQGARIVADGTRVTRAGAAFAGAELIHRGARLDVLRMLSHPGTSIIPAALAAADGNDRSGEDLIVALAAGYEVQARLTGDWIPAVQARGFRSSPIFGIFGATIAAARLTGLDEAQTTTAIALAVELVSGNLEGARSGAESFTIHEPTAARNALFATALARAGVGGTESALEGPAGFYHAFVGSRSGVAAETFVDGPASRGLESITDRLGSDWQMLDTGLRVYDVAGYHVPIIEVTRSLCAEQGIAAEAIDQVDIEVNAYELAYPSPVYPRPAGPPGPGSGEYYAAYTILAGDYPIGRARPRKGGGLGGDEPGGLSDLMGRIRLHGSRQRPILAPAITITTRDGSTHQAVATGREMMLDLATLTARLREFASGSGQGDDAFDRLAVEVADLEQLPTVDRLVDLTLPDTSDEDDAGIHR